jgi:hypothetical protein
VGTIAYNYDYNVNSGETDDIDAKILESVLLESVQVLRRSFQLIAKTSRTTGDTIANAIGGTLKNFGGICNLIGNSVGRAFK